MLQIFQALTSIIWNETISVSIFSCLDLIPTCVLFLLELAWELGIGIGKEEGKSLILNSSSIFFYWMVEKS